MISVNCSESASERAEDVAMTVAESCLTNLRILLAKPVLPICSWDWQISEPAFYEAIAPSDGCTDGFASRVREFANGIPSLLLRLFLICSAWRTGLLLIQIGCCVRTEAES